MTVETCLDFFDSHGIVEIPCTNGRGYDIGTYHFPIVDKPIGPIVSTCKMWIILIIININSGKFMGRATNRRRV